MSADLAAVCIVGGGRSHVPFIAAAEGRGLKTIVFDVDPRAPASGVAGEFHAISTHDTAAILSELEPHRGGLIGCFTYSSYEGALRTTAAVVEGFDLPGLRSDALDRMWSKPAMLDALTAAGLPTTDWVVTADPQGLDDILARHSRVVVKPARGGLGSAGVALIDPATADAPGRLAAACAASSDGTALVEAFLDGLEYSIDGYVVAGEANVLAASRKHSLGSSRGFVMAGFTTGPGALAAEVQGSLDRLVAPVMAAAGLDNSYFSLDVIESGGVYYVIDMGPLLDAKVDRLLHHAGVDVYGIASDIARGDRIETALAPGQAHALRFVYAAAPGVLAAVDDRPIDTGGTTGVIEFEKAVGDRVASPESVSDLLGWLMASGPDVGRLWEDLGALDLSDRITIEARP